MTQHEKIVHYVTAFGSITPFEAFEDLGITKLATRISELKRAGWEVDTETVKAVNRYGEHIHFARYSNLRRKEGKDVRL